MYICIEDFPQKVILIVLDKGRFLFEVGVPKFIFFAVSSFCIEMLPLKVSNSDFD